MRQFSLHKHVCPFVTGAWARSRAPHKPDFDILTLIFITTQHREKHLHSQILRSVDTRLTAFARLCKHSLSHFFKAVTILTTFNIELVHLLRKNTGGPYILIDADEGFWINRSELLKRTWNRDYRDWIDRRHCGRRDSARRSSGGTERVRAGDPPRGQRRSGHGEVASTHQ